MEALPWLRYVPGYTNTIDQWHKDELTLFRGQLDMARERLVGNLCVTHTLRSLTSIIVFRKVLPFLALLDSSAKSRKVSDACQPLPAVGELIGNMTRVSIVR
jgi:hypothetical protein